MNQTIETLLSRRSIRKFKKEQIKNDELDVILRAGMYAPSGSGKQSPIFVVVQDKETLDLLDEMNAKVLGKDTHPYYYAPTAILVFSDRDRSTSLEDGSLALGNMFNAAASLGVGSCWVHRTQEMLESDDGKMLLKKWGVEDNYYGIGTCILGYPDEPIPEAAARKKSYVIFTDK